MNNKTMYRVIVGLAILVWMLMAIIFMSSCGCGKQEPYKPTYKIEIIHSTDKAIGQNGETIYRVSFESGVDDRVSFGLYSTLKRGQTVYMRSKQCGFIYTCWDYISLQEYINESGNQDY